MISDMNRNGASTKVKDLMESNLAMIGPDATLQEAAQKMKEINCGFLPVGEDPASPMGIITDRDIVIRAVCDGKNPAEEKVSQYMTSDVCACAEEDSLEDAAKQMNNYQVSRLVVKSEDGTLCGVLTFGRIIRSNDNKDEITNVVQQATGHAA